ncbi:MAG TPA: hypothetical protein VIL74_11015 [Pyrinomonadaceae bacterium]|jgi:hypothetical protein
MKISNARPVVKILPLLILTFAALGCEVLETVESTKIPQSEIQQTYIVSANRERTTVTAHFYHGSWGKSVDLDAPSRIEHNGAELPQAAISFPFGTRYEKTMPGLQTAHSFLYTNHDGKTFRNELSFEPLELESGEIIVSRSKEVKIALSRRVGNEEQISVTLKSRAAAPDAGNSNAEPVNDKIGDREDYETSLNDELDATRTAIILKPKNLRKFARGKAVLSLEASRTHALQQSAPAGGSMRWSYTSSRDANVLD